MQQKRLSRLECYCEVGVHIRNPMVRRQLSFCADGGGSESPQYLAANFTLELSNPLTSKQEGKAMISKSMQKVEVLAISSVIRKKA